MITQEMIIYILFVKTKKVLLFYKFAKLIYNKVFFWGGIHLKYICVNIVPIKKILRLVI